MKTVLFTAAAAGLASVVEALPFKLRIVQRQAPPVNASYDYIIVGGGTSGASLAARLSEDPNRRVALIEAGGDPTANGASAILTNMPAADTLGIGADPKDTKSTDWDFVTVPQKGANNRAMHYARGKCLGGTSVLHFMIYQRGTASSYDQWESLGNPGWGWKDVLPYFHKSVTFTPPGPSRKNTFPTNFDTSDFDAGAGPLTVSYPNYALEFSDYMGRSLNAIGLPTSPKGFNGGELNGVAYAATTINPANEFRATSRSTFLFAAQTRPNLVVLSNSLAKNIIIENGKAVGVNYTSPVRGVNTATVIRCTREVIVSAGAFQSPQLLMVSGIGPAAQLQKFGIPVVSDLPDVGQNMEDHVFFGPTYPVTNNITTLTKIVASLSGGGPEFADYVQNHQGILTNNVADMLAWERIPDATLNSINASAMAAYPEGWPHLEYISAAGWVGNFTNLLKLNQGLKLAPGQGGYAGILATLVAAKSRGSVTLQSADTAVAPLIDPNWFTEPEDVAIGLWGWKRARAAFNTSAMAPILFGPEAFPGPSVQSDADIINVLRDTLQTVWHPACTCRMLPKDQGGVLDSNLKVYGVDGLRVVDASSFPVLPPGHPQSSCYMLAEKAAALIIAAEGGNSTTGVPPASVSTALPTASSVAPPRTTTAAPTTAAPTTAAPTTAAPTTTAPAPTSTGGGLPFPFPIATYTIPLPIPITLTLPALIPFPTRRQ